jgi:hypothetical protein
MNHNPSHPRWSASLLRRDLNARAQHLATTSGLLHDQTPGNSPSIIFGCDEQSRHGNFHPASYAAIRANPDWSRRLTKVHTAHRKLRARADWPWMELDCANSSDALLMNIFCHPQVSTPEALTPAVANLLNVPTNTQPHFGIHPGVPLSTGLLDRTEIDLQLNTLFLEAKLTESNFQNTTPRLIERYRDLETVFDLSRLLSAKTRRPDGKIPGYQLIRNVLAAYAADASFCVLCDARRHDLVEIWYTVLSTVHRPTFSCRLKLLTWQELAATLPHNLQQFLETKYGILPA